MYKIKAKALLNFWIIGPYLYAAILSAPLSVGAEVIMTEAEALAQAFPGQAINKRIVTLTEAQIALVQKAARSKLPSAEIVIFEASGEHGFSGRAYLDTHIVRTETETVFTVINPDGTVKMVLMLTFLDHPDYKPSPRWLKKIDGKKLDGNLQRGEGVPNMVGATLTVDGVIGATRRALAVDALIINNMNNMGEKNEIHE